MKYKYSYTLLEIQIFLMFHHIGTICLSMVSSPYRGGICVLFEMWRLVFDVFLCITHDQLQHLYKKGNICRT